MVATTILNQLGGNRFIAMTGSKKFVSIENGLQFRIPGKVNSCRIVLDDSDTYTVEFFKIRGVNVKSVYELSGVYADMLQSIFTSQTGLDTSL